MLCLGSFIMHKSREYQNTEYWECQNKKKTKCKYRVHGVTDPISNFSSTEHGKERKTTLKPFQVAAGQSVKVKTIFNRCICNKNFIPHTAIESHTMVVCNSNPPEIIKETGERNHCANFGAVDSEEAVNKFFF